MAALHHGLGRDCEVLAALFLAAAIPTGLLGRIVLQGTAERAYGAIRPTGCLKPLPGGFLVVKVLGGKDVLAHGGSLLPPKYRHCALWCQLRNAASLQRVPLGPR